MAVKIKWLRSDKNAKVPIKNHPSDSGFDIRSIEDVVLYSSEWKLIKTGVRVELPNGYDLQVRGRSGLAYKYGIGVLNAPGTIDTNYRNDIGVILINHSQVPFKICKGDRIAQLVVSEVIDVESVEITEFSDTTDRDLSGFGASGVK